MLAAEMEVIKDIPCYRVVLQAVIKYQIQQLMSQLSEHTEEESVILSANSSDGTVTYQGTALGETFLQAHTDFKSKFLNFCNKSLGLLRVCEAMREVRQAPDTDLKVPALVRSSNMRKYMATMLQVLNTTEAEQQWVLDNLGPKMNVQQTSDVLDPVNIAKVLLIEDLKLVSKYKGQKIQDIPIEELAFESALAKKGPEVWSDEVSESPKSLAQDGITSQTKNQSRKGLVRKKIKVASASQKPQELGEGTSSEGNELLDEVLQIFESGKGSVHKKINVASADQELGEGTSSEGNELPDELSQIFESVLKHSIKTVNSQGIAKWSKSNPVTRTTRISNTLQFKYNALLEVEKGTKTKTQIARELNISASTLSTWVKYADPIKEGYKFLGPMRKSIRPGNWVEIEKVLLKWIQKASERNEVMTGPVLIEMAKKYADSRGISDFGASTGWLGRFKGRHGIKLRQVKEETD